MMMDASQPPLHVHYLLMENRKAFTCIAFALFFVAGAEVFMPDSVGAWSTGNGHSMAIGFFAAPYPADQELLGAWFIPVATLSGLLVITLTRKVLRVLKNNM